MTDPATISADHISSQRVRMAAGFGLGMTAILSIALALAAAIPFEWLKPLGELVRRADDVSPERHARWVQACLGLAVGVGVLGFCLARRRPAFEAFIESRLADAAALMRRIVSPNTWAWNAAAIAVFVAGACLRLKYLNVPMAYDEAYSFVNFARRPWYEAIADYNNTNNHVLNTFFMHWCWRLFGQVDWALRLPSFFAGMLLVAISYPWARAKAGPQVALLTMALTAGSITLIDYSVNARGYMMVTAAAIALDLALTKLREGRGANANESGGETGRLRPPLACPRALWWCLAWFALVTGVWAIPIMVYPAAGVCASYVFAPGAAGESSWRPISRRLRQLALLLALAGLALAFLWTPAWVFRGTKALEHPFVQPLAFADCLRQSPWAWREGLARIVAGPIPSIFFIASVLVALVVAAAAGRDSPICYAVSSAGFLVATTLALMVVQRVAPPPRLYLFLAPWMFLLAAAGIVPIAVRMASAKTFAGIASIVVLLSAAIYAAYHPVIIDPEQRTKEIVSVPSAVRWLSRNVERDDQGGVYLAAPLPTDLPAIYYGIAFGIDIRLNQTPPPGEDLWLWTAAGSPPSTTLEDGVVKMGHLVNVEMHWQVVAEFTSLTLWRSTTPR